MSDFGDLERGATIGVAMDAAVAQQPIFIATPEPVQAGAGSVSAAEP